jgi:predicted acetyltransferase
MHVSEFVYENRDAFLVLLAFLNSQADQINYITYTTQDEFFHHLPHDPRNHTDHLIPAVAHETNTQGVGIMYRVIDTPGIFNVLKNHNFGNQTCKLKIYVEDTFFPSNAGSHVVHFTEGRPRVKGRRAANEVDIRLDVSDFSSLLVGAINFRTLYEYGQAEISHTRYLDTVNRLFLSEAKPRCTTMF